MAVIFLASLLPSVGERLAGEPSANKLNCPLVLSSIDLPYVLMDDGIRPVLLQDTPTERLNLTEGHGLHAYPLETEAKPPDPAEQIKNSHAHSVILPVCIHPDA